MLKILSVVGARPNFVKIASLCREMKKADGKIRHFLVHTGQHYDYEMDQAFFDSLGIPAPIENLGVGSARDAAQIASIMLKFDPICEREKPDWVIVVGDVNSTLAGALVAKKHGIPLAHIEAGLRSFDLSMPEEINRKLTDAVSDLLFTHSEEADRNLLSEGVDGQKIRMVGNIMIDTLMKEMDRAEKLRPYEKWGVKPREFAYVTLHRPSNVDRPETLGPLLENLMKISECLPVIFATHPRTSAHIEKFGMEIKPANRFFMTGPLSYHESIGLAKNAAVVITDSGGLQEETTFLGTPCLTLRPNTERRVTITRGTNRLTSTSRMLDDLEESLNSGQRDAGGPPPLWDGNTATRIVNTFMELA